MSHVFHFFLYRQCHERCLYERYMDIEYIFLGFSLSCFLTNFFNCFLFTLLVWKTFLNTNCIFVVVWELKTFFFTSVFYCLENKTNISRYILVKHEFICGNVNIICYKYEAINKNVIYDEWRLCNVWRNVGSNFIFKIKN